MFRCTDSSQVLKELDERVKVYPQAYVRVIGFDNIHHASVSLLTGQSKCEDQSVCRFILYVVRLMYKPLHFPFYSFELYDCNLVLNFLLASPTQDNWNYRGLTCSDCW